MRYTVRSGLVIVTFLWALGPAQIIAQERSSPSTGSNPIVSTERPPKITLRVATWASAEEFELEQRMAERFMQL